MASFLIVSAICLLAPSTVPCNNNPQSQREVDAACADFCSGRCDFVNASELPIKTQRMIVYRETPNNVTTLPDKNCGDGPGDVGFYLSHHNLAYLCSQFPNSEDCKKANAIEKGSQNNIFMKLEIEVDGHFGPYHMCNPMYGWNTSDWVCLTYCETPPDCAPWDKQQNSVQWMGLTCFCEDGRGNKTVGRHNQANMGHHSHHSDLPAVCNAQNFGNIAEYNYKLNGTVIAKLTDVTEADCCNACNPSNCSGWTMPHDNFTECSLIGTDFTFEHLDPGDPKISAFRFSGGTGRVSPGIMGGFWYSTPGESECKGNSTPGNGCAWKVIEDIKHVNSTCVNAHIDAVIEKYGENCFNTCPSPHNASTACYAQCFAEVLNGNVTSNIKAIPSNDVMNAFYKAFESDNISQGGCPNVKTS